MSSYDTFKDIRKLFTHIKKEYSIVSSTGNVRE